MDLYRYKENNRVKKDKQTNVRRPKMYLQSELRFGADFVEWWKIL